MTTFTRSASKKEYELSESELNEINYKIIEINSALFKYEYKKEDLDAFIEEHPRSFSKKNTISKSGKMKTFYLNSNDLKDITFIKDKGRYYYNYDECKEK
jgi:hypothetical protein